MKLLLSAVVLFLALAQVFCEEFGAKEDPDYWVNSIQIQVPKIVLVTGVVHSQLKEVLLEATLYMPQYVCDLAEKMLYAYITRLFAFI